MLLYLDGSAVVKLAIEEPETAALEGALATCRAAISSKFSRVECARGGAHCEQPSHGDVGRGVRSAFPPRVNDAVLSRASVLEPATLRSLDAIHLATALLITASELSFVTNDDNLARAAERHGLTTMQPGR